MEIRNTPKSISIKSRSSGHESIVANRNFRSAKALSRGQSGLLPTILKDLQHSWAFLRESAPQRRWERLKEASGFGLGALASGTLASLIFFAGAPAHAGPPFMAYVLSLIATISGARALYCAASCALSKIRSIGVKQGFSFAVLSVNEQRVITSMYQAAFYILRHDLRALDIRRGGLSRGQNEYNDRMTEALDSQIKMSKEILTKFALLLQNWRDTGVCPRKELGILATPLQWLPGKNRDVIQGVV